MDPFQRSATIPAVYIPHGGGPAFFMSGPMAEIFAPMAEFLASFDTLLSQRPRAIVVISAHWESDIVEVSTSASPGLLYDYFGFPAETYQIAYPAPGAPELAMQILSLMEDAGLAVRGESSRGWDHGVFIPLKVMYPEATIPVVAVSLRGDFDPMHHADVGRALRPLRDDGVLIIGSGMSYHNLSRFEGARPSAEFHKWLDSALDGDAAHRERHLNAWASAPSGRASHPREEHLLPLMVVSGSGSDAPAQRIWSGSVGPTEVGAWAFN